MQLDINFIASVVERDIDLVVIEELSVSEEFRDWFSMRVFGAPIYGVLIGVWHSVSDANFGETDILFVFSSESGERIALLIENNISSPPQPFQGERYRVRGDKGIKDGYWEEFRTCVIAPKRYLQSSKHTKLYDSEIAYEEILAFYSSRRFRDARFGYKAKIIQEAIDQNRRGYNPEYNDEMTAFVAAYYEEFGKPYPNFVMQKPKPRPANSDWIVFNPDGYSKGMWLCHQLFSGHVKLFFPGGAKDIGAITDRYKDRLASNMTLGTAGKSAAISISVPKVSPREKPLPRSERRLQLRSKDFANWISLCER